MNTIIYESLIDQDNEITAKFLFAIDTNVQLWLKVCKKAVFREDVNDNLIDFKPLLTQVSSQDKQGNSTCYFPHLSSTC